MKLILIFAMTAVAVAVRGAIPIQGQTRIQAQHDKNAYPNAEYDAADQPDLNLNVKTLRNTGVLSTGLSKAQSDDRPSGYYPEIYVRERAITTAMPIYPEDAIQQGITGVVQARILINGRGEVTQIKFHPAINASLKKATADAVGQWTFKLDPYVSETGRTYLSRLTFKFSINDSGPFVELYDPGPFAKGLEHLGHTDTMRELSDWKRWEEVKPTKSIKVKQ